MTKFGFLEMSLKKIYTNAYINIRHQCLFPAGRRLDWNVGAQGYNSYINLLSIQFMQNTVHHTQADIIDYSKPYSPQSFATTVNRATLRKHQNDITTQPGLLLQRDGYSVYEAKTLKQKIKASTLIKNMYASRGYETKTISTFMQNPDQFTFLVTIDDAAVGTVTLGIDSDKGLLADELYREEIDAFRKKGRKVCELSKFALDPARSSKEMVASLFQIAYAYARNRHEATDFFCEVNPRHVGPQKRMFGFRALGDVKTCPRVNAPAVLLHLDLAHAGARIYTQAGAFSSADRSLYAHCLPQEIINQNVFKSRNAIDSCNRLI